MEESNVEIRMQELEKVFKQMKEMLAANPWVELDIFKMKDGEVKEKAHQITSNLAGDSRVNLLWQVPPGYVSRPDVSTVVLSGLRSSRINETESQPTASQVLKEKASMILTVLAKRKNLGKNVKVYRRQCEHLG
jgi:hypothetical protein